MKIEINLGSIDEKDNTVKIAEGIIEKKEGRIELSEEVIENIIETIGTNKDLDTKELLKEEKDNIDITKKSEKSIESESKMEDIFGLD